MGGVLGTTFKPRSGDAYNKTHDLILLSASNRPSAVLINASSQSIVGSAGLNIDCNGAEKADSEIIHDTGTSGNITECKAPDFGGSQITGHPFWLNSEVFIISDRTNRRIHVYKIEKNLNTQTWNTNLIQTVKFDSSIHQMLALDDTDPENSIIYALSEGNKMIKKPVISISNQNQNIAEFILEGQHDMIMDVTFPTDAFGGLNKLFVVDENNIKVMAEKSASISNGMVIPRSDHKGNREYSYRLGYPNEYVNRQHLHNSAHNAPSKRYKVYSKSYRTKEDYQHNRNGIYNKLKIVDNEIRFNNISSDGVLFGEYREMDNSLYDDAQLLLGMREFNDDGSAKKYKGSSLYTFNWTGNHLNVNQLELKSGRDRAFFGHNLYLSPNKEYLYAPVGLTYDDGPHGIPFNGGIFIVNRATMQIERFHKTGKGAGHVSFSEKNNIAVLTHHAEEYVSLINMNSLQKIKDISWEQKRKSYSLITQSHSPFIGKKGKYFYNFWTDGGVFCRLDLENLLLGFDMCVETDGMPIQGNYFNRMQ